jgi:hypothetical protein
MAEGVVNAVEALWSVARNRNGEFKDRRRPSPGIAAVLVAMAEVGPTHGSAIAGAAGQRQHNVTSVWLPKLDSFGFVHRVDTVPGLGNQGGGRPAVIWALTGRGRELVAALAAELGVTVG